MENRAPKQFPKSSSIPNSQSLHHQSPLLIRSSPHESENPLVVSLKDAFFLLPERLIPPFPLSTPSPSDYTLLNRAIAYGVLTEPHLAKVHLTHLHAIVSDGYDLFTTTLIDLSTDSYPKLLDIPRSQLLWVYSKLIDVAAVRIDTLLISLLRQIIGGDFYVPNLWLSAELAIG